jgi:DNA-binding response OmpR family regulator
MEDCSQNEPQLSMLYVEDDAITRKLVSKVIALKFPAIQLRTAADGQAGLNSFTTHGADLILTDINLPRMDGFLMAKKIRDVDPTVPLIIITAHSSLDIEAIDGNGKKYCLQKPLEYRLLFACIEECLATGDETGDR